MFYRRKVLLYLLQVFDGEYKFRYVFEIEKGKVSKLMIEDWEIGQLYWNTLASNEGDENKAIAAVKLKYFDKFTTENNLHLQLAWLTQ